MGHECARHRVPCYHPSGCYAELKDRFRAGGDLTATELEFVGVGAERDHERGWRDASNLEGAGGSDDGLSESDRALLQRLLGIEGTVTAGGWLSHA